MASGDTLVVWTAGDARFPDADTATMDALLSSAADEPDELVLLIDFDPGATQEFCYFTGVMPRHYDGGGVTLTVWWTSDTNTGNVKWDAAFKSFTDDSDLLSTKVFAAEQTTGAVAAPSAAWEAVADAITFTDGAQMDSVGVGELFHLEVTRDSADAADTMNSNDAMLIALELRET